MLKKDIMSSKQQGEIIDLKKKQTVYATDKNKNLPTGEAMSVHPKVADKLLKNGLATAEKPVEGKKGGQK